MTMVENGLYIPGSPAPISGASRKTSFSHPLSSPTQRFPHFTSSSAMADDGNNKRPAPTYSMDAMDAEVGFTPTSEARVAELARQISHSNSASLSKVSTAHALVNVNPFNMDPAAHPELDPNSPKFNARQWTKTLVHHHISESDTGDILRAGFSFRNLHVHGFGTPTDFQKDVLNVFYSIPSTIRGLLGGAKVAGKTRIQILKNFEGVVRSGEMLVVLGRPGSGCSTFLKTVAGETHGFYVGEDSVINYQGIRVSFCYCPWLGSLY